MDIGFAVGVEEVAGIDALEREGDRVAPLPGPDIGCRDDEVFCLVLRPRVCVQDVGADYVDGSVVVADCGRVQTAGIVHYVAGGIFLFQSRERGFETELGLAMDGVAWVNVLEKVGRKEN